MAIEEDEWAGLTFGIFVDVESRCVNLIGLFLLLDIVDIGCCCGPFNFVSRLK